MPSGTAPLNERDSGGYRLRRGKVKGVGISLDESKHFGARIFRQIRGTPMIRSIRARRCRRSSPALRHQSRPRRQAGELRHGGGRRGEGRGADGVTAAGGEFVRSDDFAEPRPLVHQPGVMTNLPTR
jgi:hypothetical protein